MKPAPSIFTPVLIAGSIIVMVGFAIRGSFGVFQLPIADQSGWPCADFSMAIAIQNLARRSGWKHVRHDIYGACGTVCRVGIGSGAFPALMQFPIKADRAGTG